MSPKVALDLLCYKKALYTWRIWVVLAFVAPYLLIPIAIVSFFTDGHLVLAVGIGVFFAIASLWWLYVMHVIKCLMGRNPPQFPQVPPPDVDVGPA